MSAISPIESTGVARRQTYLGIAFAAIAAVAFGSNVVLYKFAFDHGARPLSLLTARLVVASVLLTIYEFTIKRELRTSRRTVMKLLGLGVVGFVTGPLLFANALDISPVSVVAPLFFTYPLWTSLLAVAFRMTPFRAKLLLGILTGMAGVLLLFSLPQGEFSGSMLALAAGFTTALYFLWAQVLIRGVPPAVGATLTLVGGAMVMLVISGVTGVWIPARAFPAMGVIGLLTAIGYFLTFESIARIGAAHSSLVQLVEPVTSILLAALFLGEVLTVRIAIGSGLVLSTLVVLAWTPTHSELASP